MTMLPQQTNGSDCGIFVANNIESCEKDDVGGSNVSYFPHGKRESMISLIFLNFFYIS